MESMQSLQSLRPRYQADESRALFFCRVIDDLRVASRSTANFVPSRNEIALLNANVISSNTCLTEGSRKS